MFSLRQLCVAGALAIIVLAVVYFWLISLGASCGNCPLTNVDAALSEWPVRREA
jgi:branched-subunit amino acid permease